MKEFIKKFIPNFLLSWYHFLLAFLGAIIYRFPSRKIKVIGVTGTNGKSTVVELVSKILEEADYKVASLSSIRFKIGTKEWKNLFKMTMPGRLEIQKFLRQAVNAGCQYAVLEVTSEGIKQHRHRFINFEAAVFTNLTPEHLEAHGGFENYRAAKGKLFESTKSIHVINIDDQNASYFLQFPAEKKYLYQFNRKCKITIQNSKFSKDINDFTLNLKLPGQFNIYNALAAVCLGLSQGVNLEICKRAVEKVKGIPGRMEEVIFEPFRVLVDYAVTPDALEKLYQTIKEIYSPQRIIAVFGACGGGRDKWKRPVLGEIAAKYCEEVILTNEDPYDENPDQILENIEEGILKIKNLKLNKNLEFKIKNYQKILNRREAIKKALELAKHGDVVVISGKGCEPWIIEAKGKRIPWDDREVVKEEFQKIYPL